MPRYSTKNDKSQSQDCLIIPLFEDKLTPPDQFGDLVANAVKTKDFEGKKGQAIFLYTGNKVISRVLLLGLGKRKDFKLRSWKQIIGTAVISCQGKKAEKIGLVIPGDVGEFVDTKVLAKSTVVAIETANYSFDEHKSHEDAIVKSLKSVEFILDKKNWRVWNKGVEEGVIIGGAVNFTRHLGNTTPSTMTPTFLAGEAQRIVKKNSKLKIKVLAYPEIKRLGMGCFLGVAQGSSEEPKFIIIEYYGTTKSQKPTVLVGKGVTFDSGGLSLKPDPYMCNMKFDMLGGATVLGILDAVSKLGLKKNVIALIPACENMPGGKAYRPDDILINMEGKSVLVDNTDAEGRLILCDALSYAKRFKPKEVVDFATLTGSCFVALGNERSGLFSPEDKIVEKLLSSSETVGEQLWRLPMGEEYSEAMKCEIADIRNAGGVGERRYGGASTAAAFLQFFTLDKDGNSEYPWAHIDLSCSFYVGKGKPYIRGGANGFGVESLVEYLS